METSPRACRRRELRAGATLRDAWMHSFESCPPLSPVCLPKPPPDVSSPLWTRVDAGQRPRHARREGEIKMLPASTYSRSIDREWRSLYDLIWRPEFFPRWASGLSKAGLRQDGDGWLADGTEGPKIGRAHV